MNTTAIFPKAHFIGLKQPRTVKKQTIDGQPMHWKSDVHGENRPFSHFFDTDYGSYRLFQFPEMIVNPGNPVSYKKIRNGLNHAEAQWRNVHPTNCF